MKRAAGRPGPSAGAISVRARRRAARSPRANELKDLARSAARIEIPLRDSCGSLRSSEAIDREVLAAVSGAVAAGKSVVLLAMDGSKFGSRCPSLDCLREVKSNWGRSVQVVVDACQMRTGRRRIRYYLDQEFLVLVTGSKFFTGPPLSGALLVPAAASAVMKQAAAVPVGLGLYTNRNDWPVSWHGVRSGLPTRPNIGQLLRWLAAVEEMRGYFNVPTYYRSLALREFSRAVSQLIADRANLRLLPAFGQSATDASDNEEMAVRTIFPFSVSGGGETLSVEDCGRIYRALNRDVSALLPQIGNCPRARACSAFVPHRPACLYSGFHAWSRGHIAHQRGGQGRVRHLAPLWYCRIPSWTRPGTRAGANHPRQNRFAGKKHRCTERDG
jgi:hypothetical protein